MRPLALIAVVAAMCSACAAEPLAPVAAPTRASFDPALIAKGAQLAAIGNCQVCHTAEGGKSFAGGRPIETPFGTFYGTNITPEPRHGIGGWSEPAFVRALREGLDRDGRHLYPAFPYEYLHPPDRRRHPRAVRVHRDARAGARPEPAARAARALQHPRPARHVEGALLRARAFRPDPARDAQWNRGAYLVNGLGHCGRMPHAAQRPRRRKEGRAFSGGVAEGWHWPGARRALARAPFPGPAEQLFRYLRTGLDDVHAIAADRWTRWCATWRARPEEDVPAMAAYLEALAGRPRRAPQEGGRRAGASQGRLACERPAAPRSMPAPAPRAMIVAARPARAAPCRSRWEPP
jgi:nicotinate dehydrogenase subunit B